ncbi:alpha/beta hydrolase [Propioniciclava soli]|uniref:Alpha/beta hydrolase n=1 Tax=Propioniciclava soli TaxID=2775081 RepID=A0ABZ3C455_9ACTN
MLDDLDHLEHLDRLDRLDPLDHLEQCDLDIGGVTVHVWTTPQQEGPAFVLVHGLGVSSTYLGPLAAELAERGRVVLFDLPGFGGTPDPERPFGIEAFASVVAEAAERLKVADAVWLGHSMGAQIVVDAVAHHPGVARAVALASPVVTHGARSVRKQTWAFLKSSARERFSEALLSVQGYLRAGLVWPLEVLPAMLEYRVEERMPALTQHLVLLRGSRDAVTPQSWIEELGAAAGAAASVRLVVVAGASHQLVVGHAGVVARELLELAERAAS